LKAAPLLMMPALARADARPLRFIPNANLSAIDPIWTTALVAQEHGYLIFDTLYGIDDSASLQPQMCEGHELSDDKLTWTFTLRDGLLFHDGGKVLAKDCVVSLQRWGSRDSFGQVLMAATNEIAAIDDRRLRIRLKKPFSQMLYGLGARNCFMMPERLAATPASEQVKEAIGSGPFRFLPGEWVSGAHAAYARFDRYVPRQEPPSFYAGGKVAKFERIEWIVQPDPATAAAALQTGEVDWVEQPLIDLCPMLKSSQDVQVAVIDPFGWQVILALNHLQPPFNNTKLRRALLTAIDQKVFTESMIGDQSSLGRLPAGYFGEGQPMASHAGLDVLTKPRNLAATRKLVAESGYAGEKVVMLSPSDRPVYSQVSQVARDLFLKLGLNVDFQAIDWGSVISRRTSRSPVDQGGWSTFSTALDGMTISNPGSNFALRGSGTKAWFGWPDDAKLESLRAAWFDAPDVNSQKAIAEQVQLQALQTVPYIPLGQIFQPTAFRSEIQGLVHAPFALFWNVHRA
ncbi:MAG TPA: ABC transporter substrate-binding protein, partial [Acetobacteraceae bacterium]|nr:ABC transporter substrate-binding protein [Acetobacteraceae bacterium]